MIPRRIDPAGLDRERPALDLPVVYDFTTAPPPADHALVEVLLLPAVPGGAYLRGAEVGIHAAEEGKEPALYVRLVYSIGPRPGPVRPGRVEVRGPYRPSGDGT